MDIGTPPAPESAGTLDATDTASRRAAHSGAGWLEVTRGNLEKARMHYRAAVATDPSDPDDWYLLSTLESDLGDPEAAATHLLHLLREWPDAIGQLPYEYVGFLVYQMDPGSSRRLELLQRLFDAQWDRNGIGASDLWYELALMRLARGEVDAISGVLERVDGPEELVKLRADRRFDQWVDRGDPRFDVERAARARADDLRVQAFLEPERLDLLTQLTYATLATGGHADILAITEAALGLVDPATATAGLFRNLDDRLWLMNNRAIALRRLGRADEALVQLQEASGLDESGMPNVSQALNLGAFYCSLGRPEDALEAIVVLGSLSGYGRMIEAHVQHCAYRQQGDSAAAEAALGYIRANREDSPGVLLEALLRAGLVDEAADWLLQMLESPDNRADALLWAQEFLRPEILPGDSEWKARRTDLLARSEVEAALRQMARVERYDIYMGNGMD